MKVKQLSVFIENTNGRLAQVTRVMGNAGVNMRAATIADTADFGILRIICEKPQEALLALKEAGFTARVTEVIGVKLIDKPGGLADIMELFEKNDLNIEYCYSTLMSDQGQAVVIFRVEDIDRGLAVLKENGVEAIASFG
jgi:hypothetical protein